MRRLIAPAVWVVALAVLGAACAVAWVWLADPAAYEVTKRGVVLSEASASGQFQVVVVFVAIGVVVSLLLGGVLSVVLQRIGWRLMPLVLAASLFVGGLTWRLGTWWGPDEPNATAAKGLSVGDRLPLPLEIGSFAVLLVWPIAGMLAIVLVMSCLPVGESHEVDLERS